MNVCIENMLFLRSGEKNCFSWTNHNYFTHQCLHLDKYTHKYEWRLWTSELVLLHTCTWQSLNLSMKLLLLQYRPSKVNSLCCPVELPPSNHGGGGGGLILFVWITDVSGPDRFGTWLFRDLTTRFGTCVNTFRDLE